VLSAVNSAIVRIEEPAALYREACRIAASIGGFALAMAATFDCASGDGQVQALIPHFPREVADRLVAEIAR